MPTYWESLLGQYGMNPYGQQPSYLESDPNMLGGSPGHIPYLPPIYGDTPLSAELGEWISRYLTPQHHQTQVTSPGGDYSYIGPSRNPSLRPEDIQSGIAMLELKTKLDNEEEERKRNQMMDQILGSPSGGGAISFGGQTMDIAPTPTGGPLTDREMAELQRGGIDTRYGFGGGNFRGQTGREPQAGASAKAMALANEFENLHQQIIALQQDAGGVIGDPTEVQQGLRDLHQQRLDVLAQIQKESPTLYQILYMKMNPPQADLMFDGRRWQRGGQ